jgi:hypothetical protein
LTCALFVNPVKNCMRLPSFLTSNVEPCTSWSCFSGGCIFLCSEVHTVVFWMDTAGKSSRWETVKQLLQICDGKYLLSLLFYLVSNFQ